MKLDNGWVVPYNPILLLKFQCHVNVEIVGSVGAVKYLYKYITKGIPRVMVKELIAGETKDELKAFEDATYTGNTDALHRLYEFPLKGMKPVVTQLSLHLENEQTVFIRDGQDPKHAADKSCKTHLTEYLKTCAKSEHARQFTYVEFIRHYTWDIAKKEWSRRKNKSGLIDHGDEALSDAIGRIPIFSLNAHTQERYFLRSLLHHVKARIQFNSTNKNKQKQTKKNKKKKEKNNTKGTMV